jgi:hypothetical protein
MNLASDACTMAFEMLHCSDIDIQIFEMIVTVGFWGPSSNAVSHHQAIVMLCLSTLPACHWVACRNAGGSCADDVLNICFTIEAAFRIIALGSIYKYLRSPWNVFDFIIICFGYIGYILKDNGGSSGVRALRAFRALRPLRAMSRFRSLRTIIDCFITVRISAAVIIFKTLVDKPSVSFRVNQQMGKEKLESILKSLSKKAHALIRTSSWWAPRLDDDTCW